VFNSLFDVIFTPEKSNWTDFGGIYIYPYTPVAMPLLPNLQTWHYIGLAYTVLKVKLRNCSLSHSHPRPAVCRLPCARNAASVHPELTPIFQTATSAVEVGTTGLYHSGRMGSWPCRPAEAGTFTRAWRQQRLQLSSATPSLASLRYAKNHVFR